MSSTSFVVVVVTFDTLSPLSTLFIAIPFLSSLLFSHAFEMFVIELERALLAHTHLDERDLVLAALIVSKLDLVRLEHTRLAACNIGTLKLTFASKHLGLRAPAQTDA